MKTICRKAYVVDVAGEEQIPVFCVVKFIICIRSTWLLCRLFIPDYFETKYHALCVQDSDDWSVIRPQQLCDHSPADYFKLNDFPHVYGKSKESQKETNCVTQRSKED